jgi:phage terminase large subunit
MMGRKPRLVTNHRLLDGINAARATIPLTYFDTSRCSRLLDCLRSYAAEWDENARTFKKTPAHNWASHGADAFRYMAMGWREPLDPEADKADPIKELLNPRRGTSCGTNTSMSGSRTATTT